MPGSVVVRRAFPLSWRHVALAVYVAINLVVIWNTIALGPEAGADWRLWEAVAASENPYRTGAGVPFIWSPVMVPVMSAVVAIGYWPWLALHVASVFLIRSPLLIGLVLVSWAFWFDTAQGNTVTFSLVAGMLALRGSRWGAVAYLALFLLMPRPLMAPLAVWLLWRDRSLWLPFGALLGAHAVAVLASGLASEWIGAMLAYRGPAEGIGVPLLLGLPLAAWLTWRGRVGWAGLAISPYLLPQYLVWPLLDQRCTRTRNE